MNKNRWHFISIVILVVAIPVVLITMPRPINVVLRMGGSKLLNLKI